MLISIHWEKIKEFCDLLGFDPADVQTITITTKDVIVTCLARENSGQVYLVDSPEGYKEVATYTKVIPIC